MVATPGRLAEHVATGSLRLTQCAAIVLDEVDVLLGDTFAFAQQARGNFWFFGAVHTFCSKGAIDFALHMLMSSTALHPARLAPTAQIGLWGNMLHAIPVLRSASHCCTSRVSTC